MADLEQTFNPNEVPEDERSFDIIPRDKYRLQIIESKIEETSSGGKMLTLTIEVVEGPYANRRLWDRLNIRNQNPDAQRIAQRALADLCLAVGIPALRDTEELHFKPFWGTIVIKKATEKDIAAGYPDDKNTVRYSQPKNQPANARPAGSAAQQAKGQPQGGKPAGQVQGNKPWNKTKKADLDDEIPFK